MKERPYTGPNACEGVKCSNEFCDQPPTRVLVNGSERSELCDACLKEEAGQFVMDNQDVSFSWNDDMTICTL